MTDKSFTPAALYLRLLDIVSLIGLAVAPPVVRIALALPFLRSGLTRWDGFLQLSVGTQFLFEEQFKLHIFGNLYGSPLPIRSPFSSAVRRSCFRSCCWRALPRALSALRC